MLRRLQIYLICEKNKELNIKSYDEKLYWPLGWDYIFLYWEGLGMGFVQSVYVMSASFKTFKY